MGQVSPFLPVKLFIGCLFQSQFEFSKFLKRATSIWGDLDYQSDVFDFSHTRYYEPEMGPQLKKCFVGFKNLVSTDAKTLASIKLKTQEFEVTFLDDMGHRVVNLDPGVVTLYNVMLLTTKNFSHRTPLMDGIYSELTVLYHKTGWQALPWTYPDFLLNTYQNVLTTLRKNYKVQLESMGTL